MKYMAACDQHGNYIGRCSILGTTDDAAMDALTRVGKLAAAHAGLQWAAPWFTSADRMSGDVIAPIGYGHTIATFQVVTA